MDIIKFYTILANYELNLCIVSAIIGVPISYISSHFGFSKSVKSISIVSTGDNYINSTCEFEQASIQL